MASDSLIISVAEARKLLGEAFDPYPDSYIENLIRGLDGIAEAYVRTIPK